MQNKRYSIRRLDELHQRNSFSCGIKVLDNYIHHFATQDKKRNIAITYVLNDEEENKIAGYYSLSSTSIECSGLPDLIIKKLPRYPLLPATLIGRLALDVNYQPKGLGEVLLFDALKRVSETSETVASLAVVVDAINETAASFYQKYGFLPLASAKLFLPMHLINKLCNTREML